MVNNTEVEAPNTDCKPKLDINCKLVHLIGLFEMLFQDQ